jgi:hypothetical protein
LLRLDPNAEAEAVKILMQVVDDAPWTISAHLALAQIAEAHGDLSHAEKWCRDALTRDPNNPDALFALGKFYARQDRVDDAKKLWTTEISVPFIDLGWPAGSPVGRSIGVLIARNFKGGWTQSTSFNPLQVINDLAPYCSEFLFTCVEREGMQAGADLVGIAPVERFVDCAPEANPATIKPDSKSVIVLGFLFLVVLVLLLLSPGGRLFELLASPLERRARVLVGPTAGPAGDGPRPGRGSRPVSPPE